MFNSGDVFCSPGGSCRYEVIGAVCKLYDREELPYPCCRLSWQSKEPFWNRVGKRFVPDLAARRCDSYSVKLLGYTTPQIVSRYYNHLETSERTWWFSLNRKDEKNVSKVYLHDGYTQRTYCKNSLRQTDS